MKISAVLPFRQVQEANASVVCHKALGNGPGGLIDTVTDDDDLEF